MIDGGVIDAAERVGRKRSVVAIVAALAFLGIQFVARPAVFAEGGTGTNVDWWAVNAIALLAVLATGGGVLNSRRIRALVHDEVSREHMRSALAQGYWVAMSLGLLLYLVPWFRDLTARQAVYLVVTGSVGAPLLIFAYLERRAHQDG